MSVAVDRPRSSARGASSDRAVTKVRARRHRGPKARTTIQAVVIAVWCLLPFYWMIVTAFRDVGFTFSTDPWPSHVTLDNFRTAFSTELGNHLGRALLNSLLIGVVVTAVGLLVGTTAAYALARLDFKGKSIIAGAILA